MQSSSRLAFPHVHLTTGRMRYPFQDYGAVRPKFKKVQIPKLDRNGRRIYRRNPDGSHGFETETALVQDGTYIHKGIDVGNGDGLSYAVRSLITGIVVFAQKSDGFWPHVVVVEDLEHRGVFHRFGHLQAAGLIAEHQGVVPGLVVGYTAATRYLRRWKPGSDMEAHLHYEITTEQPPDTSRWPATYFDPLLFIREGLYSPQDGRQHIKRNFPKVEEM